MTTEAATKKCPFCAEEIKAEAIKCRFCGEMLDGNRPVAADRHAPTHERKTFIIPFPEDCIPRTTPVDSSKKQPFSLSYLKAAGYTGDAGSEQNNWAWRDGLWAVWEAWRRYFLFDRANDFGREGWQLAEPQDGKETVIKLEDRFEFDEVEGTGRFGGSKTSVVFVGAKVAMQRTTF